MDLLLKDVGFLLSFQVLLVFIQEGVLAGVKESPTFLQKIQIFPDEMIEPEKKLSYPQLPPPLPIFVFFRVESLAEPLHKLGPPSAAQDPPPLLNKRALLFSHGWEDTHKRFSKGGG